MKVNQIITTTRERELGIDVITLLSVEEYETCKEIIPRTACTWWLRSPGVRSGNAAIVYSDGSASIYGYSVNSDKVAVRPALALYDLDSSGLQVGDKFNLFGYNWTVISDVYALCDDSLGDLCFRKDSKAEGANLYELSDIRKYIHEWLTINMLANLRVV